MPHEGAKVKTETVVLKFRSKKEYEEAKAKGLIEALRDGKVEMAGVERVKVEGNVILNEGVNQGIWPLVCGGSATNYSGANARIGVGDGTADEDPSQTDLQGTNKLYKSCDSGYPQYGSDRKCTWQATFGESEANWAWQEWSISNTANINLNRKKEYIGTKNGGVWVLAVSLTLS